MKEVRQVKIIIKRNDKYLLLKKVTATFKEHIGCWEVPGGKLEQNEDAREGAFREVLEETRTRCTIIKELEPLTHHKEDTTIHTRVFLGTLKSGAINISREHSAFCWKTIQETANMDNIIYKDNLLKYLREAERF